MEDFRALKKMHLKKTWFPFILTNEKDRWLSSISMHPETEEIFLRVEEHLFEDLVSSAAPRINFFRQFVVHDFKKRIVSSTYNIILGDKLIQAIIQYDKKA